MLIAYIAGLALLVLGSVLVLYQVWSEDER